MAEINIKITELSNAITKLQGLQSKCMSGGKIPPLTVGGGKVVNELEDMADVYKELNHSFAVLISNTISFLQNIKGSYVESDTKAAILTSRKICQPIMPQLRCLYLLQTCFCIQNEAHRKAVSSVQ